MKCDHPCDDRKRQSERETNRKREREGEGGLCRRSGALIFNRSIVEPADNVYRDRYSLDQPTRAFVDGVLVNLVTCIDNSTQTRRVNGARVRENERLTRAV